MGAQARIDFEIVAFRHAVEAARDRADPATRDRDAAIIKNWHYPDRTGLEEARADAFALLQARARKFVEQGVVAKRAFERWLAAPVVDLAETAGKGAGR